MCEEPDGEITLADAEQDPNLGTLAGPLTWLQTDQQVTLRLHVTAQAEVAMRQCDVAQVALAYEFESSDGVLAEKQTTGTWVAPGLSLRRRSLTVTPGIG